VVVARLLVAVVVLRPLVVAVVARLWVVAERLTRRTSDISRGVGEPFLNVVFTDRGF
jgi:hypothetical protein